LAAAGFSLRGGMEIIATFQLTFSIDKSVFEAKMLLDAQSLALLVNKAKKMAKIKI